MQWQWVDFSCHRYALPVEASGAQRKMYGFLSCSVMAYLVQSFTRINCDGWTVFDSNFGRSLRLFVAVCLFIERANDIGRRGSANTKHIHIKISLRQLKCFPFASEWQMFQIVIVWCTVRKENGRLFVYRLRRRAASCDLVTQSPVFPFHLHEKWKNRQNKLNFCSVVQKFFFIRALTKNAIGIFNDTERREKRAVCVNAFRLWMEICLKENNKNWKITFA